MKPARENISPLPRVPSPPFWSWHYARVRYLPAATSALAVVAVIWLWSANLPEPDHVAEATASRAAAQTNIAVAEAAADLPGEEPVPVMMHD